MIISGLGCWVVDYIYQDIDFSLSRVSQYISKDGKNGLVFGEATLMSHLVEYFGKSAETIIRDIGGEKKYKNLGGVAIITTISAAQLLYNYKDIKVYFYANLANNEAGNFVLQTLKQTPVYTDYIYIMEGDNVVTHAFCGKDEHGETSRTFICAPSVHPSTALKLEQLDDNFYNSDINVFSCIQWEPEISKNFSRVLKKSKENGSITIVGTANDPLMRGRERWILGDSDEAYEYIDILIMDKAEALYYSGTNDLSSAISFFKSFPIQGILITDGTNPTYVYGNGNLCLPYEGFIPIVEDIGKDKKGGILEEGDAVGCGDNFAGGVVASIAMQLRNGEKQINIKKACIMGNLSGGIASTVTGGLFIEKFTGERKSLIDRYYEKYLKQLEINKQKV